MDTFKGLINEFVDWITGIDSISEQNVTDNLPVSGAAIRLLLLSKLLKPFVYYEDVNAGLYRLFSSDDAKQQWINYTNPQHPDYDLEKASKLELFNFVRPGDTALEIVGINNDPRYIISGSDTSGDSPAIIDFWVNLKKEEAGVVKFDSDSFIVTYTITDSNGKVSSFADTYESTYCNHPNIAEYVVRTNIYKYLTEGSNNVSINIKAQNSSAFNNIEFSVYLVKFELESTFEYNTGKVSGSAIEVPFTIRRSVTNLPLTVTVTVDGVVGTIYGTEATPSTWETNSAENILNHTIKILNNYSNNTTSLMHNKHTIRISAEMTGRTPLRSNVLFYDFVTMAPTEVVNSGITNKFINIAYDSPSKMVEYDDFGNVILQGTQYSPFILNWSYYTDLTNEQSINVQWCLKRTVNGETQYTPVSYLVGSKGKKSTALTFIPSEAISKEDEVYLVARYNNRDIDQLQIIITGSQFTLKETSGMAFKLNAFGKNNSSRDAKEWIDSINGATTTFSFDVFDNMHGWNDNSLIVSGTDYYATINYCPIATDPLLSGKTIEFEFKSENVANEDDVILMIGSRNRGRIEVRPTSAGLYVGSSVTPVVETNFKANEKIKLAFIFNPITTSSDKNSDLIYIVNNGILERAGSLDTATYNDSEGKIYIGGSNSGIRLYNMRIYDRALTYSQALDNYIYDADDKGTLISRNDIIKDEKIDYLQTISKIDTILIEGISGLPNNVGDLTPILTPGGGKTECVAKITRTCFSDRTKDFVITNARVRKHGQSTLNYPIASLKIWFNKSGLDGINTIAELSSIQTAMNLNKNRYLMKDGAIPANKFVLQANYADSSGVHNGGLERLINDTWYNATFGKNKDEYRLRTAPQLFTTNKVIVHNDEELNEIGDNIWTEGLGSGIKGEGKGWQDITGKNFPYNIRTAPDSFACAVFYKNINDDAPKFLGLYVFMDDKKSDYNYGERSIYSFGNNTDPFVLNIDNTKNGKNGKQDTSANRVWNNNNVLRVEVVLPNYELTSYMNYNVDTNVEIGEDGEVSETSGLKVPCDTIKYDTKGNKLKYYWEEFFDLIYPDPDDMEDIDKFASDSEFNTKTKPFLDWLKWITGIGTMKKTNAAGALLKFEQEASQHLDLYKLAAYYIFFLRFGLVDSVERNAQLKTYDGIHWHYEPWDMDIALGNTNLGLLVFNPPMDRNSLIPGTQTYAFSGKSARTSNVLWDCLEAWEYWSETIVPEVAQALYDAGLTYDNINKIFDEDYVEKWSETIYNNSGDYKYILNGGKSWLAWLQGSRTSHRHWWLSTSMNYYDAKWSCGDFNKYRVSFFTDKAANLTGLDIMTIKPTSNTFFKVTLNDGTSVVNTIACGRENPAQFNVTTKVFSAKDPSHIYGAKFIEEIDMSCFGKSLNSVDFSDCYDDVLGAPVKKINVGIPYTEISENERLGYTSNTMFRISATGRGHDALENLTDLNINGQSNIIGGVSSLIEDRKGIVNLYAIGTGITSFNNSTLGNKFNNIELSSSTTLTEDGTPVSTSYIDTIIFNDASWNNLSFWSTEKSNTVEYLRDENNEIVLDNDNNPVFKPNIAVFRKTTIPAQLGTLKYKGSTASNPCAGKLLLEWIQAIEDNLGVTNPGFTEEDLYDVLKTKLFEAENINWGNESDPLNKVTITYNTLARIAKLNNGYNQNGTLTGYIKLADEGQDLTAVQLSNIRNWFGEGVFDLNSIYNGLVIDHSRRYAQISVGGVTTINGELYLKEPNAAILSANKFVLGTDDTKYTWHISTKKEGNIVNFSPEFMPLYARISEGEDGITRLLTQESVSGNYKLYIKVSYVDNNVYMESLIVEINVIAVTYPTTFNWNIGQTAREFLENTTIANNIFGQNNFLYSGNLIPAYELGISGVDCNIGLIPSENNFTATIQSIEYRIRGLNTLTALSTYPNISGSNDIDEFISALEEGNIITIHTKSVPQNEEMALYRIEGIIRIGGKEIHNHVNFILMDDNEVILEANQNTLFTTISGKYATDYGLLGAYFDFYKSHLLSLYGTLNISDNAHGIASLRTRTNKSLFIYLENITDISITGCQDLPFADSSIIGLDKRTFNFDNIKSLRSISINDNSNITGVLDLTKNSEIITVNLEGTSLGVVFSDPTIIRTLLLGSPTSVNIPNPTDLGGSETTCTILATTNLTNLYINSQEVLSPKGFYIFNKLYI